jgi:class 3 adenylate cyclase
MVEARKQERVVFFCDCHNFSRLMNELGESSIHFVDRMYRECGDCIVTRGGRIVKYMGDAILAVFDGDGAEGAVAAAMCARSVYRRLIAEAGTTTRSEMEVGLSFGPLVEGVVGHPTHQGWDVFGETVNEAAVIGHHLGIAMTDALRRRLPPSIEVRQIEPCRPKWRTDPLLVWEVTRPDAAPV